MQHIWVILWKQLKDTVKNKTILIQFIMFPCLTIVMENAISIEDMPEHFFANLFAVMYLGMAPLTSAAAIISEENEKNTLRVLKLCNVKAIEYLTGNAIYVISICMLGSVAIGLAGGYRGSELVYFLIIMLIGHTLSCIIGAIIGVRSKSQMSATSISVPVMMILSFLPMLSTFNDTIKNISRFIFSGQLYMLINKLESIDRYLENVLLDNTVRGNDVLDTIMGSGALESLIILLVNIIVVLGAFLGVYKKQLLFMHMPTYA